MTTKEQFPIGTPVQAVPDCYAYQVPRRGIKIPNNTGTVTGYGRSEGFIMVRRTGQKISQTYAARFWEPVP